MVERISERIPIKRKKERKRWIERERDGEERIWSGDVEGLKVGRKKTVVGFVSAVADALNMWLLDILRLKQSPHSTRKQISFPSPIPPHLSLSFFLRFSWMLLDSWLSHLSEMVKISSPWDCCRCCCCCCVAVDRFRILQKLFADS